MANPGQKRSALVHALVGAATLIVAGMLFVSVNPSKQTAMLAAPDITIIVEHGITGSLEVSASADAGPGIIEFTNTGDSAIALRLPREWTMREVRGGAITDVTSETRSAAIRWTIPPLKTLSFLADSMPAHVVAEHSRAGTLLVKVRRVYVGKDRTGSAVHLSQDGIIQLW